MNDQNAMATRKAELTSADHPDSSAKLESIASRAEAITFFEDRAQVTRRAVVSAQSGVQRIRIAGLSLLADDPSLVVKVLSDSDKANSDQGPFDPPTAKVLSARVYRDLQRAPNETGDAIQGLEDAQREARAQLARLNSEVERQKAAQQRLTLIEQRTLQEMQGVPSSGSGSSDGEQRPAEQWTRALEKMDERWSQLVEVRDQTRRQLRNARRALEAAEQRLADARALHWEYFALADVQLEVGTPGQIELELRYMVPCALWRPSHLAQLTPRAADSGSESTSKHDEAEVRLERVAAVWQQTGERWENVLCRFSTARPAQDAAPPLLTDDVLTTRLKTDVERKQVRVEVREVDVQKTGPEGGTRDIRQMPGVDDGGKPLEFEAPHRVSIPSDGRLFRVPLMEHSAAVDVQTVCFPERSPSAYLRARCTWEHAEPLLAGPVFLMRGSEFAGRAEMTFTSPGDVLELSFGVDSNLSVRREVQSTQATKKLSRKRVEKHTVKLYASNLSGIPRTLELIERVPVSEIEDVAIEVEPVRGATGPDRDGMVRIQLDLAAGEHTERDIVYRMIYGSKVVT